MSWKRTVPICVAILLGASGLTWWIFATEPEAERIDSTRESAMRVEVVAVERGDHRPRIAAVGVVSPERDVSLAPRVDGEIVTRSTAFTPGGQVAAGELLVELDPADYETELARRRSALHRAEAQLALEMGRQEIARQDYELIDRELTPANEGLVLRVPQLETAKAAVEDERAAVRQAELDLERTRVRAPFDALVLARDVDVGSQVAAGEPLGRLVGVERYWVIASVPLSKLRLIDVPTGPGQPASRVSIRDDAAWPEGLTRTGTVDRQTGALDATTRLARVLVTVEDPLAPLSETGASAPLTIGAFVEVRIEGREFSDVVRLDRRWLRQDDTAWVLEDGVLAIRELELAFTDERWAYVVDGLETGDRVVISDLATVAEGAPLRLSSAPESTEVPE